MAETKTYKGKKNEYYAGQQGFRPRDTALVDGYYIGPLAAPGEPHGMQNEPVEGGPTPRTNQGKQDGKETA